MKNQKNLILASLLVLAVLSMSLVSATTTLQRPIANSNHSGTITLISCQTDLVNADNATILYNLTTTGTARNILVANISNTTTSGGSFNASSTSVSALTDSLTYTFWCMVTNTTGFTENGTVNTGITVDNTAPICSATAEKPTFPYKGSFKVTWSITDALSLVSNSVTIDGPQTQTTKTYTTAVSETTLLSEDTGYTGDWLVTATGTDRAGNACTQTASFKSYLPDGTTSPSATAGPNVRNLVIVGLIIGVIFFLFFRKK